MLLVHPSFWCFFLSKFLTADHEVGVVHLFSKCWKKKEKTNNSASSSMQTIPSSTSATKEVSVRSWHKNQDSKSSWSKALSSHQRFIEICQHFETLILQSHKKGSSCIITPAQSSPTGHCAAITARRTAKGLSRVIQGSKPTLQFFDDLQFFLQP